MHRISVGKIIKRYINTLIKYQTYLLQIASDCNKYLDVKKDFRKLSIDTQAYLRKIALKLVNNRREKQ